MIFLMMLLSILWFLNILGIIIYGSVAGWDGFLVTAIIGVTLTGIVPGISAALFGKDKTKNNELSTRRVIHVASGVVGSIGTGLSLGYAIKDGNVSENIWFLILTTIIHVLSGTVAHLIFVDENDVYKNNSSAYELLSRQHWYGVGVLVSTICIIFLSISTIGNDHIDSPGRLLISSAIHFVAFCILLLIEFCREDYELQPNSKFVLAALNYTILNTAAVVSMMGLRLSLFVLDETPIPFITDLFLVATVYIYLVLVHC